MAVAPLVHSMMHISVIMIKMLTVTGYNIKYNIIVQDVHVYLHSIPCPKEKK